MALIEDAPHGPYARRRWIWNLRTCDCGRCPRCKNREAAKRYYRRQLEKKKTKTKRKR